jgi:hypothetical protein
LAANQRASASAERSRRATAAETAAVVIAAIGYSPTLIITCLMNV